MRKEVVFAILGGITLGVIIAFGVLRANRAITTNEISTTSNSEDSSDENSPDTSSAKLTIARPENLSVQTKSPTLVSGITSEENWVVVSAEDEDYIFIADSDGSFEQITELIGGLNEIVVVSFSEDESSSKNKVSLVYSTQFRDQLSEDSGAEDEEEGTTTDFAEIDRSEASDEDEIRESVKDKIRAVKDKAVAFLGGVTDKLDNTIQTTSEDGEIEQISVGDGTEYASIGKTTKEVTYDDLAIGDYVIAMGFANDSGVLIAKRILITTKPDATTRTAVIGTISENDDEDFVVTNQSGQAYTVDPVKKVAVFTFDDDEEEIKKSKYANIEEGDVVIIVGSIEGDVVETRTIQIISPISTDEE